MLCTGLVASQFFRVSNAVIAPELMVELAIGTETMGVVSGTYFLAFAAMQIPAGILLDRYGARRMVPGHRVQHLGAPLVGDRAEDLRPAPLRTRQRREQLAPPRFAQGLIQ